MPRRRRTKITRIALPAPDLESKIMEMLRGLKACARLKGVSFFFVESFGQEPNWFAQPFPARVSEACRRAFVSALAGEKGIQSANDATGPPKRNGPRRLLAVGLITATAALSHSGCSHSSAMVILSSFSAALLANMGERSVAHNVYAMRDGQFEGELP